MLRLCVFMIFQEFMEKSPSFLLNLNEKIPRLITTCLELCLGSDLQEKDSEEAKNPACMQRVVEGIVMCESLLKKIELREY